MQTFLHFLGDFFPTGLIYVEISFFRFALTSCLSLQLLMLIIIRLLLFVLSINERLITEIIIFWGVACSRKLLQFIHKKGQIHVHF